MMNTPRNTPKLNIHISDYSNLNDGAKNILFYSTCTCKTKLLHRYSKQHQY